METRIILGSSSPYRRELLTRFKLPFEIMAAGIDESRRDDESPKAMVERLAIDKARAVMRDKRIENGLIIGSDQTADLNGRVARKTARPRPRG